MRLTSLLLIGSVFLIGCSPQASISEQTSPPPPPVKEPLPKAPQFTDEQRLAIEKMLHEIQGRKPYIAQEGEIEDEEKEEPLFFVDGDEPEQQYVQVPQELSIIHLTEMELVGSDFTLERVVQENEIYTRYAISYKSNGLLISGILNIPNGEGPYPLAVLNHGYIDPEFYTRGRGLKREQDFLARRGYAVLHSDYRGHAASDPSPNASRVYDGMLEYSMDVINGIQAIQDAELPSIDTSRVGMLGHSMGGGISMIVSSVRPDLIDATVLYAPVSSDAWENYDRWRHEREDSDRTLEVLRTNVKNPNGWHLLSAKNYLYRTKSPFLVFHGARDADVPIEWSEATVAKLKEIEKEVEYVAYPNEKHEFITSWDDFMARIVNFFDAEA